MGPYDFKSFFFRGDGGLFWGFLLVFLAFRHSLTAPAGFPGLLGHLGWAPSNSLPRRPVPWTHLHARSTSSRRRLLKGPGFTPRAKEAHSPEPKRR